MAEAAWIGLFCRDKTISVMMGSGFQKSAYLVIDSPPLSCYNNDNFIKTARLRPNFGQVEWGEIPRESVTVKPLLCGSVRNCRVLPRDLPLPDAALLSFVIRARFEHGFLIRKRWTLFSVCRLLFYHLINDAKGGLICGGKSRRTDGGGEKNSRTH